MHFVAIVELTATIFIRIVTVVTSSVRIVVLFSKKKFVTPVLIGRYVLERFSDGIIILTCFFSFYLSLILFAF